MEERELAQIIRSVQSNKKNFDMLYPLIENKIYFWCLSIVKSKADAEDIAQLAMIQIYKKVSTLKNPEAFNTWMYRIVTNFCYRYLQNKKKKEVHFLKNDDFLEDYEMTIPEERRDTLPKEIYDLKELKEIVASFINRLPTKQREAITLFYMEEFSIKEIASILSCDEATIKARLHYGRRNLEQMIVTYEEENDIKLYSIPILGLLGSSLLEERKKIGVEHNFHFKPPVYYLSFVLVMKILLSLLVGIIMIVMFVTMNSSEDNLVENSIVTSYKDGYKYIHRIEYDQSYTKDSVTIKISLQQDIKEEDIQVKKQQKLPFTIKDNILYIQAKTNGIYTVYVKDEMVDIHITNIDKQIPELVSIYNYNSYIKLDIQDEYKHLNYEQSYIIYKGNTYQITKENTVVGKFEGQISIVLVTNKKQVITYNMELK